MIHVTRLHAQDPCRGGSVDAWDRPWELRMDPLRKDAFLGTSPLGLTAREFQVFDTLVRRTDQVVSPAELLEAMWGTSAVGDAHPVHVYISRLRTKLVDAGPATGTIHTVRGSGYLYSQPAIPDRTAGQDVRLIYDRRLIVRVIDPDDRPFLGWQPVDVLDTFFLLTNARAIHGSQRAALAMTRIWAAIGMDEWSGPMIVRTGDGSTTSVHADMHLMTRHRRFVGMRARIRGLDGQL